jgi:hypothetical protein
MGAVGVVVLALGGAQQGERPLRGQRGPGQHDLEQDAHLGHGQGRAFFPLSASGPGPGNGAPGNSR